MDRFGDGQKEEEEGGWIGAKRGSRPARPRTEKKIHSSVCPLKPKSKMGWTWLSFSSSC
jgi:hypothetical protein